MDQFGGISSLQSADILTRRGDDINKGKKDDYAGPERHCTIKEKKKRRKRGETASKKKMEGDTRTGVTLVCLNLKGTKGGKEERDSCREKGNRQRCEVAPKP